MIGIMATVFLFLTGNVSWAGSAFAHRQNNQQKRILNGVRKGQITNHEYFRLNKEQTQIKRAKRRASADGYVSPRERSRINHLQKKASRHIYHAKHNRAAHYNK